MFLVRRKIKKHVRFICILSFLTVCIINPYNFPNNKYYPVLRAYEIASELRSCPLASTEFSYGNSTKICPRLPEVLRHFNLPAAVDDDSLNRLAIDLKIRPGGKWSPTNCIPWQKVAIIVPYRNRLEQLKLFLKYMHPFLQTQSLNYVIVVVEQNEKAEFNRGKLFNIGFKEMARDLTICCFIFHDVDLFPESSQNVYGCSGQPRHMCSAIDIFRYVLPYPDLFGGVVAFTREQFELVNGYSNLYFGWGGEDDDLSDRVKQKGMEIERWEWKISRYIMLSHTKASPNPMRYILLADSLNRIGNDGVNSVTYKIISQERQPLFTHYVVDVT